MEMEQDQEVKDQEQAEAEEVALDKKMVRLQENTKEDKPREQVMEVPINMELLNNKLNYIISLIEKEN